MPRNFGRVVDLTNGPPGPKPTGAPKSQGDTDTPGTRSTMVLVERENLSLPKGMIGEEERTAASPLMGMLPIVNKNVRKTGTI